LFNGQNQKQKIMNLIDDKRVVMTLDAGGTNLVFSAMQGATEIVEPISFPASATTLSEILNRIISGFEEVKSKLKTNPAAISFAFPGPAEYNLGIIGDLENMPLFRGGVALGPMLAEKFGIPVFINNDGDLFAYGEAIAGLLPEINSLLEKAGNPKRYKNLLGATFGTGFGGGIVTNGELFMGDNSAQGEINRIRNKIYPFYSAEESVSIRGVKKSFAREARISDIYCPEPETIFKIGTSKEPGNKDAARKAFEKLAIAAGDALANSITLVDGLIVIGGGLSGAWPLFLQKLVAEMNKQFETADGHHLNRLEVKVFNLENEREREIFVRGKVREIEVPFSNQKISYDPIKRIGVGISRMGTSMATSLGAYAFALNQLNRKS
jgi:glucokinase